MLDMIMKYVHNSYIEYYKGVKEVSVFWSKCRPYMKCVKPFYFVFFF